MIFNEGKLTHRQRRLLKTAYLAAVVTCGLMVSNATAQTTEWDAGGAGSNWNTAGNWNPEDVPGVPANIEETALFSNLGSAKTTVAANTDITLSGLRFNESTAYTITYGNMNDMVLSGFGIDNQSTATQTFSINHQNGSLTFNNNAAIVGGAGVIINNGGTLTFNNDSSAATTADSVTINNTRNLIFNNTAGAGFAIIDNSGNQGVVTFNNTSSAEDAEINNSGGGDTIFNAESSAGDATITNSGNNSSTTFNSTAAAGTATITNSSSGDTIFNNTSNAGDATIINDGTGSATTFNTSAGAGTADISNINGGDTVFNNSSSAESAVITNDGAGSSTTFNSTANAGSATITNINDGDTTFNNTSSAGDATIINDGTGSSTTFANNTGAGTADITSRNGGSTAFNGADAESAVITNEDGGTTTFSNNSTGPDYDTGGLIINEVGGTTIFQNNADGQNTRIENEGTVDITSSGGTTEIGSIAGGGQVLLGNRNLEIGNLGLDDTISGVISGNNGQLIKVGDGNLTLTGNNTYTGDTTVEDGTLTVGEGGAGSITSDTAVESNGTLSGNGTIFGDLDINGGTLAPGSTDVSSASRYGQLTVDGDVAIDNGSTFVTNVNGTQNSSLYTTGNATLDGDLAVNVDGPIGLQRTYEVVVTEDGRSGTFDTVYIIDDNGDFVAQASYDDFVAYLTLRRTTLGLPDYSSLSENQRSVARSLDEWFDGLGDGSISDEVNAFFEVLLNGNVERNLTSASGEGYTGLPVASQAAARRFLDRFLNQLQQQRGGKLQVAAKKAPRLVYNGTRYAGLLAQATPQPLHATIRDSYVGQRSSLWATIGRANDEVGNGDNSAGFDVSATEYQIGYNHVLSPRTVVGVSIGKSDGRFDANDAAIDGDTDTTSIGVALRHDSRDWYATGGLAYNRHNIDTERSFGGFGYDGDTSGRTIELSGEVGKKILSGQWRIEPNLTFNLANTRLNDFGESGGPVPLDVDGGRYNTRRLGIGVRVSSNDVSARFRPYFSAAYHREFGDRRVKLNNTLAGIGAFDVEGTELGRNIFSLRLGADARVNDRLSVIGEIGGSWRDNNDSQYIFGGVKYGF